MKVLITGGTGRLGKALVPRLVEAGHDVRVMTRQTRDTRRDGAGWAVADLATGDGIAEAVAGMDVVVHLASAPYKGRYTTRVDVDGTRRLATAARSAGARHLLYLSIVGTDRVPWPYFRAKVRAEELVKASGVEWSILRATQFHEFVDAAFVMAAKLPVLIMDPGIPAQTVDVRDVADRLVVRIAEGPTRHVEDFGGPETLSAAVALDQWLLARAVRRPMLRVRLPGRLGRAFRAGHLVTTATPTGRITWHGYLEEKYGGAGSGGVDVRSSAPRSRKDV